jgi:hypothetical protein
MPVELSERELFDAIAVLGERHDDGARIARHALGWLGWEGEGPLLLRRYDVQVFTWYQLPAKFLASLEDKREVARGVALTLEQLGGQAATYARALRSHETDQLLESWELSGSIGRMRFRELLADSGLEPPDTELLNLLRSATSSARFGGPNCARSAPHERPQAVSGSRRRRSLSRSAQSC